MRYLSVLIVFVLGLLFSCNRKAQVDYAQYKQQILQWRQHRLQRLTRPDGWLSLAGLFWLHEGNNTFGFGKQNDIQFPGEKSPGRLGTIILQNGQIRLETAPGAKIRINDKSVKTAELHSDADGKPTIMSYKSYLWYVIKRGDRYAIRLKNTENPAIKNFKGIAYFPIDLKWRIRAKFVPYKPVKKVPIPTEIGTVEMQNTPGYLEFKVDGKVLHLNFYAENPSDTLWTIFADETSGRETYGAGRFLEVPPPDRTGMTVIDFNKAYNPPCAFTDFATCPMAPKENFLPIRVTAGEKYGGDH